MPAATTLCPVNDKYFTEPYSHSQCSQKEDSRDCKFSHFGQLEPPNLKPVKCGPAEFPHQLTQGIGNARISTVQIGQRSASRHWIHLPSVKTSDQALAIYIVISFIQVPWSPVRYQLYEIGRHCRRFAKKKAIVQAITMATIVLLAIMNHFPRKIL